MIKIGNKQVNKIMIGNKEVLKVVQGDITGSGIVKYAKSSPTPTGNPYKAVVRDYDGSGTYQIIDIYDNSNNTLIGTSQPVNGLAKYNPGIWRYQLDQIRAVLSNALSVAGIYGTINLSNSTGKLHMVYSKTGWAFFAVYVRVSDNDSNVYYTQTVSDAVTDAVQDISISPFPVTTSQIPKDMYIGGYSSTDYTSGSSNFTLNKVSTTLEFDFDVSQ